MSYLWYKIKMKNLLEYMSLSQRNNNKENYAVDFNCNRWRTHFHGYSLVTFWRAGNTYTVVVLKALKCANRSYKNLGNISAKKTAKHNLQKPVETYKRQRKERELQPYFTRASGRGGGRLKISTFLGPTGSRFARWGFPGPEKVPGPPPSLALVLDVARIKIL